MVVVQEKGMTESMARLFSDAWEKTNLITLACEICRGYLDELR